MNALENYSAGHLAGELVDQALAAHLPTSLTMTRSRATSSAKRVYPAATP
jgi:hypothetical protein